MGFGEVEACGDNERLWNRRVAQALHPARFASERGVLEPLDAHLSCDRARTQKSSPLTEPKGLRRVAESVAVGVGHDAGDDLIP
eukprot:3402823-Prymnesium_polylepis.2